MVVEGENNTSWKVVTVGGGNGGHDFHGLRFSSSYEVPSRGLRDEGEDEDEEDEGGEGGDYVEIAPCGEDVGKDGEEGDAGGEEVEGGHANCTPHFGAHRLGGEDEGAEADATGAAAGEEAEEDVEGVVGGEGC